MAQHPLLTRPAKQKKHRGYGSFVRCNPPQIGRDFGGTIDFGRAVLEDKDAFPRKHNIPASIQVFRL